MFNRTGGGGGCQQIWCIRPQESGKVRGGWGRTAAPSLGRAGRRTQRSAARTCGAQGERLLLLVVRAVEGALLCLLGVRTFGPAPLPPLAVGRIMAREGLGGSTLDASDSGGGQCVVMLPHPRMMELNSPQHASAESAVCVGTRTGSGGHIACRQEQEGSGRGGGGSAEKGDGDPSRIFDPDQLMSSEVHRLAMGRELSSAAESCHLLTPNFVRHFRYRKAEGVPAAWHRRHCYCRRLLQPKVDPTAAVRHSAVEHGGRVELLLPAA